MALRASVKIGVSYGIAFNHAEAHVNQMLQYLLLHALAEENAVGRKSEGQPAPRAPAYRLRQGRVQKGLPRALNHDGLDPFVGDLVEGFYQNIIPQPEGGIVPQRCIAVNASLIASVKGVYLHEHRR
jgi:hypothetical protein